jgi:hypothetical protein
VRPASITALAVAALAAAAAIGYAELVADLRTSRSNLAQVQALGSNISIAMADYHHVYDAMKAKYGPDAKTLLHTPGARLTTEVNGVVVEEGRAPFKFDSVTGLFAVGPRGRIDTRFPFQLNPRELPSANEPGSPVRAVKGRFAKELPARYLDFDAGDAITDTCTGVSRSDAPVLGVWAQLEAATFCVVYWKGAQPASMLIGVALAPGDPWLRPLARRICRGLTAIALDRIAAIDREPPPDYAACVLVDRPTRVGASETLTAHVYERDATLAVIE